MASDKLHIRLHDAKLERCVRQADNIVISITKWDETPLRLRCREVVLLKEVLGGFLEELVELDESDLLAEAGRRLDALHYPAGAADSLRHFQLRDDSNCPVLDVICKEIVEE